MHLPSNPGRGGRNQDLSLTIAREIADTENLTALIGGSDGTEEPGLLSTVVHGADQPMLQVL